ncbi:MAG: hypothetical protein ACI4GA_01190 [Acutalibacteraceae bacterium]
MDIKQFNKNTRYDYWQRWKRRKFTKENKKMQNWSDCSFGRQYYRNV